VEIKSTELPFECLDVEIGLLREMSIFKRQSFPKKWVSPITAITLKCSNTNLQQFKMHLLKDAWVSQFIGA
jgi:hypothetical protein